jgi:hypothetical protein
MLQRLIEQKDAVPLVLSSVSGVKNLDGDQWRAAVLLVDALRPFLDVTTVVSATRFPTLSMVVPLLDGIMDVLKEEETSDSIPCSRTALIHELQERFDYIRMTDIYYVATVVDPRYKIISFTEELHALQARNSVVSAMERAEVRQSHNQCQPGETSATVTHSQQGTSQTGAPMEYCNMELRLGCLSTETVRAKSSIWDRFDRLVSSQHYSAVREHATRASKELFQQELDKYISEDVIDRSTCPFRWWSLNYARFSELAAVAREHLAVPCTSVPSERVFSKAGEVVTKKRSSIKPAKADQTIFLMENL